jgi:phage tail-like protein
MEFLLPIRRSSHGRRDTPQSWPKKESVRAFLLFLASSGATMRLGRSGLCSLLRSPATPGSGREEEKMTEFTVNPTRFDPYKNFKFRVKWDGKYVAGVSRVSGLRRRTEVIEHREGGDPSTPRLSPGRTSYDAVTLERGVTHDAEFELWANAVWKLGGQPESALGAFRKDVLLDLFNEAGQLVIRYIIHRAWISDYSALPALDSDGAAIAIESITLANEGWERDPSVEEPKEPGSD